MRMESGCPKLVYGDGCSQFLRSALQGFGGHLSGVPLRVADPHSSHSLQVVLVNRSSLSGMAPAVPYTPQPKPSIYLRLRRPCGWKEVTPCGCWGMVAASSFVRHCKASGNTLAVFPFALQILTPVTRCKLYWSIILHLAVWLQLFRILHSPSQAYTCAYGTHADGRKLPHAGAGGRLQPFRSGNLARLRGTP